MSRPTSSASRKSTPGVDDSRQDQPEQTKVWGKTLKRRVEDAFKRAPRFLFACISASNKFKDAIYCPEAIIPYVFLHAKMPESIFQMPLQELQDHNYARYWQPYRGCLEHSLLPPWEMSLRSATMKAIKLCDYHTKEDVSIIVLDTQGLSVIHDADFHHLEHPDRVSSTAEDVFLAFGVVPSTNFQMVPLRYLHTDLPYYALLNTGSRKSTLRLTDIFRTAEDYRIDSFNHELRIALRFGEKFGQFFELPVACMVIASLARHTDHHVSWLENDSSLKADAIQFFEEGMPIRHQRFNNAASLPHRRCLLRSPDSRRGMSLLRAIIKHKQAQPAGPKSRPSTPTGVASLARLMGSTTLRSPILDDGHAGPSTPESSVFETDMSDAELEQRTRSQMDNVTKRMLQEAQKHTPRYLFRGWRNGARPSGGIQGLNTPDFIKPRAFASARADSHKSIFDLTREELRDMCAIHLAWETPAGYETEFSSWSPSIEFAARFCYTDPSAYISIIDTKEFSNVIVHVPQLHSVHKGKFDRKTWEYLAHGVIRGSALKAVPLQAFRDIGAAPFLRAEMMPYTKLEWRSYGLPISAKEMSDAESVGPQYGRKFGAAVMLAILCAKQRDRNLWRDGTNGVDKTLEASMSAFDIPQDLCADASILSDIVYTRGFGDVEQMIRMLRAIVNLRYGRGARLRDRIVV